MTVVNFAQCSIALLLLCLDLGDVRVKGTPLLLDDPAIARIRLLLVVSGRDTVIQGALRFREGPTRRPARKPR